MSSLRNTLFMRLMDQRDAKAAAEQQAQHGAVAKTGALANTAGALEQQSRGQNQQLATGLGAAAGISGEPMPELEDPRMAQYAEAGYAPAQQKAQMAQAALDQKGQIAEQSQAAVYMKLKQQYEHDKAKGVLDTEKQKIDWYNAKSQRMNAETGQDKAAFAQAKTEHGWRDAKLSPGIQKTVNSAISNLGYLKEIRALGDTSVYFTTLGRQKYDGMVQNEREGTEGLKDPEFIRKGALVYGNMQEIATEIAHTNFGASQTASELKRASDMLLRTDLSPTQVQVQVNRLERALTRYVTMVNKAGKEAQPGTADELDRYLDAIYTEGNKATADTPDPTGPIESDPNADIKNIARGVVSNITPSKEDIGGIIKNVIGTRIR